MPAPLDYARYSQQSAVVPVIGMLLGLSSGPDAYAIFYIMSHWFFVTEDILTGIAAAVILICIALAFGVVAHLRADVPQRWEIFTWIGIAAPGLWGIAYLILLAYALCTFE